MTWGKMRWFGTSWGAPLCGDCPHAPTPVGARCSWCGEPVLLGEQGIIYANGPVAHRECSVRSVLGGRNHLEGRCTCCGGTEDPDPPGLSRREAARAAERYWEEHG